MSGHERSESQEHREPPEDQAAVDDFGRLWPDDFSLDEKQFAAEMRELFPIEDEVLPPLFVQTLLEDDLRAPLRRGYTRQLTNDVMRRLGLPRTLAPRRRFGLPVGLSFDAITDPIRRAGAPMVAALSLLMALVLGTVYLATPSFAQGLRILLGQTGAQQIENYPTDVARPSQSHTRSALPSASVPVFWLGPYSYGYSFIGMSQSDQQDWANGPVFHIQYSLTQPGQEAQPANTSASTSSAAASANTPATPATGQSGQRAANAQGGSRLLDICEFQVASQDSAVLLAIQDGSATMTSVNGQPAVYVDGMWVQAPGGRRTWQTGTRSMLIFERQGMIFWITGDQRDGLTAYPLTQIAAALTQTTLSELRPNRLSTRFTTTDPDASIRLPLGANTDIVEVIARGDGSSAPTSKFVTLTLPTPAMMN